MEKQKNIKEKWLNYGFYSKDLNQRNLSLACELLTLYLEDDESNFKPELNIILFPIVIEYFKHINDNLSLDLILRKVEEIVDRFSIEYNDFTIDKYGKSLDNFIKDFIDDIILPSIPLSDK